MVEIGMDGYLIGMVTSGALMTAGGILLPITGIARILESKQLDDLEKFNKKIGLDKGMTFFSLSALVMFFISSKYDNKYTKGASDIIGGPMGGMNVLYLNDNLRGFIASKKAIQTKLIYMSRYIHALKTLSTLALKNEVLSTEFPQLKNINKELKKLAKKSNDVKQLLELLETETFKGEADFFSWYGRMSIAYRLLYSVKEKLLPFIMTGAQLDVYSSSATLVREFKDQHIAFCFPEYLTNQEYPQVILHDFWNPAIDPNKAIPNSLTIGGTEAQNIMVTGPNAGGKSTTMKGVVLNIILAQSLGIAATQSLSFTPFSTIMTYMNIPDDIAAGKSHFRAEAARAREILRGAQTATKGEFTFVIVDEVFNGTTFHEAQAATYALLEEIISNPYTSCVAVTHLPAIPVAAEKSGKFKIYKVTSSFKENGSILYSHKLHTGISQEPSIAFKILKEEGFNDRFLDKATDFLAEHKGKL